MDSLLHVAGSVLLVSLLVFSNGTAVAVGSSSPQGCDLYRGSWVYDESYPLSTSGCPYAEGFDCQRYGRPDKDYLKYRWKPQGCDVPRFDGLEFLRRWAGKKIMFVGDSLSVDMWASLNCMIYAAAPNVSTSFFKQEPFYNRTFQGYGVSVMLWHSLFLVDYVTGKEGQQQKYLKLDSISDGEHWRGVDLLVFNTGHWWFHRGSMQPWDYLLEGNTTYKDMDRMVALSKGLATWARWVEANVDPATTKVFFQGPSPGHAHSEEWGGRTGGSCKGETRPLQGGTYPGGPSPLVDLVKGVLSKMSKPVELLDITLLSQLRVDGHPVVYSSQPSLVDCSHWCLPGVPDTWNQLLYASLLDAPSRLQNGSMTMGGGGGGGGRGASSSASAGRSSGLAGGLGLILLWCCVLLFL